MKKPKRMYKQSDLELRFRSRLVYDNFLIDKADFLAHFTEFEDPFADEFRAAVDAIDVSDYHDSTAAMISLLVSEIQVEMEQAREQVTKFFSYVRIAFRGDRAAWHAFGSSDVPKALHNYSNMMNLLEKMNRQAELADNKAVLLGAGMTQADIDGLLDTRSRIDAAFDKLSDAKSARVRNTKTRIEKHNHVWSFMQRLSAASKLVYYSDPAKRRVYNLNFGRKKYTKQDVNSAEEGSNTAE